MSLSQEKIACHSDQKLNVKQLKEKFRNSFLNRFEIIKSCVLKDKIFILTLAIETILLIVSLFVWQAPVFLLILVLLIVQLHNLLTTGGWKLGE